MSSLQRLRTDLEDRVNNNRLYSLGTCQRILKAVLSTVVSSAKDDLDELLVLDTYFRARGVGVVEVAATGPVTDADISKAFPPPKDGVAKQQEQRSASPSAAQGIFTADALIGGPNKRTPISRDELSNKLADVVRDLHRNIIDIVDRIEACTHERRTLVGAMQRALEDKLPRIVKDTHDDLEDDLAGMSLDGRGLEPSSSSLSPFSGLDTTRNVSPNWSTTHRPQNTSPRQLAYASPLGTSLGSVTGAKSGSGSGLKSNASTNKPPIAFDFLAMRSPRVTRATASATDVLANTSQSSGLSGSLLAPRSNRYPNTNSRGKT